MSSSRCRRSNGGFQQTTGLKLTILEVHVGTPIETCRDINKKLLADVASGGGYADAIFENLVYRYEEPNGMTRWDSPLFTVPWEDETPPFEAIWEAMIGSDGKGKVVKPNQATVLVCTRAGPLDPYVPTARLLKTSPAETSHRGRLSL